MTDKNCIVFTDLDEFSESLATFMYISLKLHNYFSIVRNSNALGYEKSDHLKWFLPPRPVTDIIKHWSWYQSLGPE